MSADALLPPLLAVAALLVLAGAAKLRHPAEATAFLASVGLPAPLLLVRASSLLEVGAGGAALVRPSEAAAVMALLYLVFTALVTVQLRQTESVPCGCLGPETIPPSRVHLCLNVSCLAVCVAAVAAGPPSLLALAAANPLVATVALVAGVTVALLAAAATRLFPETLSAWQGARV
jgi:Methylamine utilisation protein MauE